MNHTYRVIYNESTNTFVAVSEIVSAKGKKSKGKKSASRASSAAVAVGVAVVGVGGAMTTTTEAEAAAVITSGQSGVGIGTSGLANSANGAQANQSTSVAIGQGARANSGGKSIAIGGVNSGETPTTASGDFAVAVGSSAQAIGLGDVVVGANSKVHKATTNPRGGAGVWFAPDKTAPLNGVMPSVVVGFNATSAGFSGDVIIGAHASNNFSNVMLVDQSNATAGNRTVGQSTGIGSRAFVLGDQSTALGADATALGHSSIAIGGDDYTTAAPILNNRLGTLLGTNEMTDETVKSALEARFRDARGQISTLGNTSINLLSTRAMEETIPNNTFGSRVSEQAGNVSQTNGLSFLRTASGGEASIAIGTSTQTAGAGSVAVGLNALAFDDAAISQGVHSRARGLSTIAIGTSSDANGSQSNAIGFNASTTANNATAIGTQAKATAQNTVAIGTSANATKANAVALGSESNTSTDATTETSATVNGVTYSGFAGATAVAVGDQVSVGDVGKERQIKHVAPGAVTATSTDAINGSQLYVITKALQETRAAATAGANSYFHANNNTTSQAAGDATTNFGPTDSKGGATGAYALAAGVNATATGVNATAIGTNVSASTLGSIVIGTNSHLKGPSTGSMAVGTAENGDTPFVLVGYNTSSQSRFGDTIVGAWARTENPDFAINQGTVIGNRAIVYGDQGVAVGADTLAAGNSSVAIGGDDLDKAAQALAPLVGATWTGATGSSSTDITNVTSKYGSFKGADGLASTVENHLNLVGNNGRVYPNTAALGDASLALGTGSQTLGVASNAIGANALAKGLSSNAIGTLSRAWGESTIAVGTNANASTLNSIVLGRNAKADAIVESDTHQIVIGNNATSNISNQVVMGSNTTGGNMTGSVIVGTGAKGHTLDVSRYSNHTSYNNPYSAIGKRISSTGTATNMLARNSGTNDTETFGSSVTVVGYEAEANAGGVALGDNARAVRNASGGRGLGVAIGANSVSSGGGIAVGSSSITEGINAVAIGRQAVAKTSGAQAIGVASAAVGNLSLAVGSSATSTGERSIAIGSSTSNEQYDKNTNVRAEGKNAIALGATARVGENYTDPARPKAGTLTDSELADWNKQIADEAARAGAFTENSIAIGTNATVKSATAATTGTDLTAANNATNSLAVGSGATVTSNSSIAMGHNATASGENSTAIGRGAVASGRNSISVGLGNQVSGNNSGAFGDPSVLAGTNSYSVGNNHIIANNTDNAISIGGQNNVGGTGTRTNGVVDTSQPIVNGDGGANRSMVIGFNNTVNADDVMVLGNNVTVTKDVAGSVILGQNSSTAGSHDIATVNEATVNGVTYGQFAGDVANAGRFVSVGAKNDERKIINLAAGNISATSTEAINGSQLYAVIEKMPVVSTVSNEGGKVKNDAPTTQPNAVATTASVATAVNNSYWTLQNHSDDVSQVNPGDTVNFTSEDKSVTITATKEDGQGISTLDLSVKTDSTITNNNGVLSVANTTLPVTPGSNVSKPQGTDATKFVNAGDLAETLNNLSFNVQADKVGSGTNNGEKDPANTPVKVGETVKFIAGDNINIAQDGANFTISAELNELPPENTTLVVEGGKVSGTTPAGEGNKLVNATTVTDAINNVGFTVSTNGTPSDKVGGTDGIVNAGDTLNFVDGNGTTARVTDNGGVTFDVKTTTFGDNSVTNGVNPNGTVAAPVDGDSFVNASTVANAINNSAFNLTTGGNTDTTVTSPVKAGSTVTISGGAATSVSQQGTEITINTKYDDKTITTTPAGDLTVANTTLTQPNTPPNVVNQITAPSTDDATKFVNAGDLANTLNNLGFNVDSAAAGGTVTGNAKTAVKTGDTVTFKAGENIKIAQEGQNFTISAELNELPPENTTLVVEGGKVSGTTPAGEGNKLVNATTVTDAINNVGFTVSTNGTPSDKVGGTDGIVNAGDTLNFVNGTGTTARVTDNGGITFDVNTTTFGNPVNNPNGIDSTTGKVAEPVDGNSLVNASTVANAINNAAHNVTIDKTTEKFENQAGKKTAQVKAGDTLTFVAGQNLVARQDDEGRTITFATDENVTFNNVTASNITVGGTPNTSGGVDSPITISNVDGKNIISNITGNLPNTYNTDALNPTNQDITTGKTLADVLNESPNLVNSLNNAATVGDILNSGFNVQENAQARDFIKAYDTVNFVDGNGTTANVSVNADGTVANVTYNVKVDNKTVKIDENGNLVSAGGSVVTQGSGTSVTSVVGADGVTTYTVSATGEDSPTTNLVSNNNGTVGVPTGNGTHLVNADQIANAVNNSGFNVVEAGKEPNADGSDLVKAGDTLKFANGTGTTANVTTDGTNTTVTYNSAVAYVNDNADDTSTPSNTAKLVSGDDNPVQVQNVASGVRDNVTTPVANPTAPTAEDKRNIADAVTKATGDTLNNVANIGDLQAAAGAAKTEVIEGDNMTVTSDTGANGQTIYKVATKDDVKFNNVTASNITVGGTPNTSGGVDSPITISNVDGKNIISNITGNLPNTYNTDALNPTNQDITTGKTLADVLNESPNLVNSLNNAATVGDILNSGFNVQENAQARDFIKAYDTVNFVDGNGTTANVSVNADGTVANVTYNVKVDNKTVKIDENGNLVSAGGSVVTQGSGTSVTSVVGADGVTTYTVSATGEDSPTTNLVSNNNGTVGVPTGNGTHLVNADQIANAVNNSGFNVVEAGKEPNADGSDLVKAGDTLKFANGTGTTANVTTDGTNTTVTYNSAVAYVNDNADDTSTPSNTAKLVSGDDNPVQVQNVASGVRDNVTTPVANPTAPTAEDKRNIADAVTKATGDTLNNVANIGDLQAAAGAAKTEVIEGDNMTVTSDTGANGQTIYKVATKDDVKFNNVTASNITVGGTPNTSGGVDSPITISNVDGKNIISNITGNLPNTYNTDALNPTNQDITTGKTLADVLNESPNLVNSLNNAATVGDILNSGFNVQENAQARDFIKAYDTVNFVDGNGTTANVSVNADGTVANVTYNVKVDNKTVKIDENGNLVSAGGSVVTQGSGTSVTSVVGADGVTTYTVSATGEDSPTTNLVSNNNGTVGVPTGNGTHLVNADQIANAVNNSGFNVVEAGKEPNADGSDLVKAGDTLKFANGTGTTANVTTDGTNTTVTYNSAVAYVNDNADDTSTPSNTAKLVSGDDNPVQVQNVASGVRDNVTTPVANPTAPTAEDKRNIADAVTKATGDTLNNVANIGDLQAAAGAAKTEVIEGDNMTVTSDTGANGQTIYKVATKDDVKFNNVTASNITVGGTPNTSGGVDSPITISNVDGKNIISNITGNLPNTYNTDALNPTNQDITTGKTLADVLNESPNLVNSLNNAATVGDILNSGFNVQENAQARDFIKAYDTVNFVDGNGTTANVSVNADGTVANVTYNVKVDNKTVKIDENGNLVSAGGSVVTQGSGTSVTSVVGADGVTTYTVSATGEDSPTTNLVSNNNGTVGVPTGNGTHLVNADQIANAVNNSGFNVVEAGKEPNADGSDLVKAGDTLKFANGTGTTANVTTDGTNTTVTYNSAVAYVNDNADDTSTPSNTAKLVSGDDNPVQVQNVASGVRDNVTTPVANPTAPTAEDKRNIADAVTKATGDTLNNVANIGDLQAAAGAAKTEVIEGDNMTVTSDTGANGQTIYKVATKDDVKFNNVTASNITVGGTPNTSGGVDSPITISNVDGKNIISNITGNLPNTYNTDALNPTNQDITTGKTLADVLNESPNLVNSLNNAATVGDILNSGFNVQENAQARDFIKAYDTVNFVDGNGTTANVSVNADGTVANVTYNVKVDNKTVKIDENGNLVSAGGSVVTQGSGTSVTSVVGADGVTTYTVSATGEDSPTTNLVSNNNGTVGVPTGNGTHLVNADQIANAVNNSGFNVVEAGKEPNADGSDLVKAGDTLKFANGTGTTANVTTDGTNTTVTYNSAVAYVNDNADDTSTPSNTAKLVSGDDNPVQVQNVASGVRDNVTTPVANPTAPTAEDKRNIADAVTKATGDTLNNVANIGDLQAAAGAAKTEVIEGDNMTVTSDTGANGQTIYKVATKDDVKFNNVTASNITVGGTPNTSGGVDSPITISNVDGKNIISNITGNLPNTYNTDALNPTNQDITTGKTLADVLNESPNLVNSLNNAATVGDILNSGFNVQENAQARDFIKAYDTVNFVDGNGTTANVSVNADGTVANVTYNVKVDNKTVKIDENGNLVSAGGSVVTQGSGTSVTSVVGADGVTTYTVSATGEDSPTTNLVSNNNGTVGVPTGNGTHLVNADQIANAVNNSGFNVVEAGKEPNADGSDLVKAGDTLKFANGTGTTANVTTDGTNTTVTYNSAVAYVNDNADDTSTPSNTAKLVSGDDNPVQVQNVASGVRDNVTTPVANPTAPTAEDKRNIADAVTKATGDTLNNVANIGDLQAAAGAAKTEVIEGDNMTVTSDTGANGQTIYKVATKDDVKFNNVTASNITVGGTPNTSGGVDSPITISNVDGKNIISNITGNLPNTYNTDALNPTNQDITTGKTLADVLNESPNLVNSLNNAATVGDILNSGFNVQENAQARDFIKAYDTVNFVDGNGTTANVSVNADGTVANVTYNVKVDNKTVKIDENGNLVSAGGSVVTQGSGTSVTSVVGADGVTTYTVSATGEDSPTTNLVSNNNGTVGVPTGNGTHLVNADQIANAVNNSGFNVVEAGKEPNADGSDLVKAGDTLKFANGTGTTANVTTDGTNTTVTYNSAVAYVNDNADDTSTPSNTAKLVSGDDNPVQVQNVASGVRDNVTTPVANPTAPTAEDKRNIADAVTKATGDTLNNVANIGDLQAAAGAAKTEVKSDKGTIDVTSATADNGQTVYNVEVANTTLNVSNGPTTANSNTPAGKVETPVGDNATKFVNAGDLANAINNAGFTLSANGTNGTVVNAGEVVDLNNTDGNIVITKGTGDNNVTFGLADTVKVGGNTANNPITINSNTGKIDGLTGNLPDTYNDDEYNTGNNPVSTNATLPSGVNVKNAATVGDVLNSGFNVQGNGEAKDFVKAYDTVNFENGTGTTAVVETSEDGKVTNVTFNSALAYVDGNGNVTDANGKPLSPTNAVKLVGGDKDAPVTITGATSGLTPTAVPTYPQGNPATGTPATPVTANLINFDNNPVSSIPDSTVATVGDLRNLGWVVSASQNGYSDAVRSSNEVDFVGADGVTVTGETVNGKRVITISGGGNGGTTVSAGNHTTVTATTTPATSGNGLPGTDYKVDVNTAPVTTNSNGSVAVPTTPGVANATDVANAVNNSGWNLQANGENSTLVKPSNNVSFNQGDNIAITKDGNNITVATTDDINVKGNLTVAGNSTVGNLTVRPNSTIDAGDNKITNVAPGTVSPDSKDAINGSQLYQAYQVLGGNNQSITTTNPTAPNNGGNTTGGNTGGTTTNPTTTVTPVIQASPNTTVNVIDNSVNNVPTSNNYTMVTYNVEGQKNYITNNVIEAIGRINEQGIQFFHTNDGTNKTRAIQGANDVDSSASGAYATAVGHRAEAAGVNAVAMGRGSKALAEDSIAIGTGNVVTGKGSMAIGDPSYVTGENSASLGNHNRIATNSTYVLGSNVTQVTDNSVFLGAQTGYTYATGTNVSLVTDAANASVALTEANIAQGEAQAVYDNAVNAEKALVSTASQADKDNAAKAVQDAQTALNTANTTLATAQTTATNALNAVKASEEQAVTASIANNTGRTAGTSTALTSQHIAGQDNKFAGGDQVVGVVSVGSDTETRRIQNVAPGLLSADSTDAINGSQLYALASNINANAARTVTVKKDGEDVATGNTINFVNGTGTVVNVSNTPVYTQTSTGDVLTATTDPTTNAVTYTKADGTTVASGDVTTTNTPTVAVNTAVAYNNADGSNNAGNTAKLVGAKEGENVQLGNVASGVAVKNEAGDLVTPTNIPQAVYNATGTTLNNAATIGDLKSVAGDIHNRIDDVVDDANAGISSAMAAASLPQAYLPGKSMLTGGVASYNGQGAVAVGMSKLSDNGRWVLKLHGSADTRGNVGGAVGAGFHF